jgi:hypothetical protein
MDDRRARWLGTAFLAGAVTDALALVPMLSPPMARLLWGFEASDGACRFAMGSGASLMPASRMVPTWALPAGLLALVATAYHWPRVVGRARA